MHAKGKINTEKETENVNEKEDNRFVLKMKMTYSKMHNKNESGCYECIRI